MVAVILFLRLAVGHFLCDYPLQGDFLAQAKNHKRPIPNVPFYQALLAHAAIQGGAVWFLTGSIAFGAVEFVLHAVIDYLKNEGTINYNQDQALHLACKAIYSITFLG
jgi:hypothetical protein